MTQIDAARSERDARQRRLRLAKLAVAGARRRHHRDGHRSRSSSCSAQRNKAVVAQKKTRCSSEGSPKSNAKKQKRDAAARSEAEEAEEGIAAEQKREEPTSKRHRRQTKRKNAAEEARADRRRTEAEAGRRSQAGRRVRSVHRPDRPGERQDQRQRVRLRAATARCEQAGAAELGMGPAGTICASWAPANYKAAGPVDAVAYSPDGKSFATGDWSGKLTVRDAQTGASSLPGAARPVRALRRLLARRQANRHRQQRQDDPNPRRGQRPTCSTR